MAYSNQHYQPYIYDAAAGGSRYPAAAASNPFASASEVNLHAPYGAGPGGGTTTYPPHSGTPATGLYQHEDRAGSAWSLDDHDLAGSGAGGYDKVQRSADNPFAEGYKGGRSVGAGAGGGASSRKKWIWIGLVVLVVVGGIAGGIAAWKATSSSSSSSSSSSGGSGSGKMQFIDGTAKVVKSNPSDPSQFEKDSRLKSAFWGMAYTPKNVLEEYGCGATLANVTEDIQLLSQLTTRIRTYSTSCNQTQLTLQAIDDTKVNMTVWIGAYVGDNSTVNEQQQQDVLDALTLYGTEHVSGITIGNEYVLGQENSAASVQFIVAEQAAFRTKLAALNLDKSLPVGTSDAGSSFNAALTAGSDYIMANVHPWFGGLAIDQAAGWTWDFFEQNDVVLAEAAPNKPTAYIAETGWPTRSMTPDNATLGAAVAGVSELQTFLDTYPCQANANQSYYFYFEPFDEPWKERYGGVEPYWGLFDSNKVLKDVTIPDCPIDSTHSSG
ncbi:hypothetical protein JCM9279_001352 [Rhodotorula babjevae]